VKRETYDRYGRLIDSIIRLELPVISNALVRRIYDRHFFDHANREKERSSRQVAEIIDHYFDFDSVLDIGCGMGLYLYELSRLNKEVYGCDSSLDGIAMASKEIFVFYADATKPLIVNRDFDLVICFEVAEHIQKRYSGQLVQNCVKYGKRVLFTAAPKGQGGVGHINEQPTAFWVDLFGGMHYSLEEERSNTVRDVMKRSGVVAWIANNFMSFHRSNRDR